MNKTEINQLILDSGDGELAVAWAKILDYLDAVDLETNRDPGSEADMAGGYMDSDNDGSWTYFEEGSESL